MPAGSVEPAGLCPTIIRKRQSVAPKSQGVHVDDCNRSGSVIPVAREVWQPMAVSMPASGLVDKHSIDSAAADNLAPITNRWHTGDNVGMDAGERLAAEILDAIKSGRDLWVLDQIIEGPDRLERARRV